MTSIYFTGVVITAVVFTMIIAGLVVFYLVADPDWDEEFIFMGMPMIYVIGGAVVSFGWPLTVVALIGAALAFPFAKAYRDKEEAVKQARRDTGSDW